MSGREQWGERWGGDVHGGCGRTRAVSAFGLRPSTFLRGVLGALPGGSGHSARGGSASAAHRALDEESDGRCESPPALKDARSGGTSNGA
eukprot:2677847-Prymnesium_polylepis.1